MRDVFAYRLRVLEAVTANAAMPLIAGEDVRTPLGAFRVVFGIGHFRNYHSDRADYDSDDRASPAACHGFREVAKSGGQPEPARPRLIRRLCVAPAFGLRPPLCTTLVTRREDQSASSERLYNLLVVGRPLQLSGWVEAVPASNSLAAATGKGAFWDTQETTSDTMRSSPEAGRKT